MPVVSFLNTTWFHLAASPGLSFTLKKRLLAADSARYSYKGTYYTKLTDNQEAKVHNEPLKGLKKDAQDGLSEFKRNLRGGFLVLVQRWYCSGRFSRMSSDKGSPLTYLEWFSGKVLMFLPSLDQV